MRDRKQFLVATARTLIYLAEQVFCPQNLPMLWNVAEPRNARGFESSLGIEATSYGAVDDRLFLLVHQCDQFLLRVNRLVNTPIRVIKETHNRILLIRGREHDGHI